jgi:hypothetical protein
MTQLRLGDLEHLVDRLTDMGRSASRCVISPRLERRARCRRRPVPAWRSRGRRWPRFRSGHYECGPHLLRHVPVAGVAARVGGRDGRGVLPPPWVRATLAVLSEPGSVQTMRSLAACSPVLKVARAMRDPGMGYPSGADGERLSGQTPNAGRRALCICCRTDRFVYWPSATRLSLAECPGCQRPGPASRDIAPPDGRPAAESSRTTPMARGLSATSRLRHLSADSARAGTPRP